MCSYLQPRYFCSWHWRCRRSFFHFHCMHILCNFFSLLKNRCKATSKKKNNKNARMNDRAKNGKKREKMQRGVEKKNTRLVQEKGSKTDAHKMRSGSGILQLCALLCGVKMHGKLKRERERRTGCIRNRSRNRAAALAKRKGRKAKKRIAK